MSSITSQITTIAPDITSFGAGGQQYIASLRGGFNISSEQNNPLFSFSTTDTNVTNARQLTNLTEARKVGSTMAFRAYRLGLRVVSFGTGVVDPADAAELKRLLASAEVVITVGSNETRIAEFSGLDLMEPVDLVAADATNTCAVAPGLGGGIGWIPLQIPLEIQANVNIGGFVRFTRAVPASLTSTPNSFGFIVIMQGLKVVKS